MKIFSFKSVASAISIALLTTSSFVAAFEDDDDDRADAARAEYESLVNMIQMRERYGMDLSEIQVTLGL